MFFRIGFNKMLMYNRESSVNHSRLTPGIFNPLVKNKAHLTGDKPHCNTLSTNVPGITVPLLTIQDIK